MKKGFRKMAAVFLALCLTGSYAYAAEETVFSDLTEDAFLREAAETLSGYGILEGYPDGTFRPDGDLTRAEMAAVIVRMLKMEHAAEEAGKVNSKYTDVTIKHWANGSIILATDLGVLQGNGDGTFAPDEKVTYEQAVKMLVCALGYDKVLHKIPDAYPVEYLLKANELGLTRNAGGKTSDPISRGTAAKIAYNTLSAPLLKQTSIGGPEGDVFTSMDGKNGNPLETMETVNLDNCKFYLLGGYNHVLLSAADLQSAEAEPVEGSTNIHLKCTETGAKKLEKITEVMSLKAQNKVLKGLVNGQFLGEAAVEKAIVNGEVVLKGGFSEAQAKEAVQAINDAIQKCGKSES